MNSVKYFLAIALIFFLTMLIVMTGCHNNCTHEHVDNVMDSVKMDCGGEYHGKEGKSEYGEYEANE